MATVNQTAERSSLFRRDWSQGDDMRRVSCQLMFSKRRAKKRRPGFRMQVKMLVSRYLG